MSSSEYIMCPICHAINFSTENHCIKCGTSLKKELNYQPYSNTSFKDSESSKKLSLDSNLFINGEKSQSGKEKDPVSLTISTYRTTQKSETLIDAFFYFPYICFSGHPTTIVLSITNRQDALIENLEINIQSAGLSNVVKHKGPTILSNSSYPILIEIAPESPGDFVMQIYIKFTIKNKLVCYMGARLLRINPQFDTLTETVDLRKIKTNRPEKEYEYLDSGEEKSFINLINNPNAIKNYQDLFNLTLPEFYEPISLILDYTITDEINRTISQHKHNNLIIPRLFLDYIKQGKVLNLLPMNDDTYGIRLVAKNKMTIGRKRDEADYIAWFMPRSPSNDEKTKHISKVHITAEAIDGKIYFRNESTSSSASLDGKPLSLNKSEILNQRAILLLADEYFIDVQYANSYYNKEPTISNISLWNGPDKSPTLNARGSVRFLPINSDIAFYEVIWIFTDASFGASKANQVVINADGLSEFQGRFLYYRGCFWLENRISNNATKINSMILEANEVAPLINGQLLQLGNINYHVEVI